MADAVHDGRLRELAFLAKLEREGAVSVPSEVIHGDQAFKSMLVHLLREECVNGLENVPVQSGEPTEPHVNFGGKSYLQLKFETRLWAQISEVLRDQGTHVRISHKGRVRRSELEQELRTGRDREPFGILWAERHRDQAVAMAVLAAQARAPVSLLYLDMNGLKTINDTNSHAAGDEAIRIYLQTVAMVTGEKGEGFRSGGADEVLVVMRITTIEDAQEAGRNVLKQLQKERVVVDGKEVASSLTAACGVVSTTDPGADAAALIRRADEEQKRAKEASKGPPRASVLAVEGKGFEKVTVEAG